MKTPRYFRFYRPAEDADDAPELVAHRRSTDRWQCEFCRHLNPASETSCQECGRPNLDLLDIGSAGSVDGRTTTGTSGRIADFADDFDGTVNTDE